MGFLASLLSGFLGSVFKALLGDWTAKRAGAKEQQAVDQAAAIKQGAEADAKVQEAADAGAAVDRRIDTPGGLRDYESTDPYNRDNH